MVKDPNGSTGEDLCNQVRISIDHLQAHLEQVAVSPPDWTLKQWLHQEREWRHLARHLRHETRRIEYLIRHCTLGTVVARRKLH